jgi:hypothetical protein
MADNEMRRGSSEPRMPGALARQGSLTRMIEEADESRLTGWEAPAAAPAAAAFTSASASPPPSRPAPGLVRTLSGQRLEDAPSSPLSCRCSCISQERIA